MPTPASSSAVKNIPGILAAFIVMLAGFWLADRIGQAILAAQGLTGVVELDWGPEEGGGGA